MTTNSSRRLAVQFLDSATEHLAMTLWANEDGQMFHEAEALQKLAAAAKLLGFNLVPVNTTAREAA